MNDIYKYKKYKAKYLTLKRIINNQNGGSFPEEILKKKYSKDVHKLKDIIKSIRELLPKDAVYLPRLNQYEEVSNKPSENLLIIYYIVIITLTMLKKFKTHSPDYIALITDNYMQTINFINEPKEYNTEQYCSRFIEIFISFKKGTNFEEFMKFPTLLMELLSKELPRTEVIGGNIKLIIEFLSNDAIKKIQSLREKINDTVLLELIKISLSQNKNAVLLKEHLDLVLSALLEILKEKPTFIFDISTSAALLKFYEVTYHAKYYANYKDILKRTLMGEKINYCKEIKFSKDSLKIAEKHDNQVMQRNNYIQKLEVTQMNYDNNNGVSAQTERTKLGKDMEYLRYKIDLPFEDDPEYPFVNGAMTRRDRECKKILDDAREISRNKY